jgi:hypothetical protein
MKKIICSFLLLLFFSTAARAQVPFYDHYKYCSSNYDLFPVIVKCSLDRRSEYLKRDSWARAQRSAMGDHFDAFLIVTEEKLKNKKITAAEAKLLVTEKLMNLEMQVKRNSNRDDDDDDDFTSFMRNLGAVTDDLQRREQQRIDQYYNRGGGSGTTCTTQKVGQSYKTVCN